MNRPMNHTLVRRALSIGLAALWAAMLGTARAESADLDASSPLRVGAAAASFAADDSMQIGGHIAAVHVQGQEGELRAVATVIEQPGSGKFAIVACDVLFVTREMIDRTAEKIEKSCGIEPAHLLVNATHTHGAPSTVRIHDAHVEPEFVRSVEAGIVKAVEEANARLTDHCRFLFHLGQEPNVGQNSRMLLPDGMISWGVHADPLARPTGPFDPELPVWVFRGPGDKLLSVIYNHSTHTVGSLRPNVRSPSFYGLAAQALEAQWGAPVCFLEGASGSTHNGNRSIADLIADLKRDVAEGVEQARPREVKRIAAAKRPFRFNVRVFDEATEDKKVVDFMTAHSPGSLDLVARVFREARLALKPEQGQERETSVQVILIGDVALVGVPAEFFTVLGMEIKKRSPFADTYVAELANDWIGYLPDREAHQLGGYQTWTGFHSFAEIGTGERMVDQAVAMLDELASQSTATGKQ
jgi:neutral ceramidase